MASFALILWPFLASVFFFVMGPGRGLIWSVAVGYLILPEAMAIDFPGLPSYDKVSAISMSALLGVVLTRSRLDVSTTVRADPKVARRLMLLLFIVCFIVPLGTWQTNPEQLVNGSAVRPSLGMSDALNMSSGMVMRFIPLVLAFYVLRTEELQRELLIALVVMTLAYTPLILFEWRMSPQLHTWVYGYFQHVWLQHVRGGGFRPIVFLSHGLVVGLLLMTALLAALSLSRDKTQSSLVFLLIAFWIFLILFMSRNFGALVLAVLFGPVALLFPPRLQVRAAVVVSLFILTYPAIKQLGYSPDQKILEIVAPLAPERAHSFGVRLDNESMLLDRAAEKPVFGWGGWGRTRVFSDTGRDLTIIDGLWIVIMGQYGWVGYLSFFGVITLPFFVLRRTLRRKPITPVIGGIAAVMSANLLDLIPNSTVSPLAMMMLGALYAFLSYDPVETAQDAAPDAAIPDRRVRYSRFPPVHARGSDA
jgi:hypothetical protein